MHLFEIASAAPGKPTVIMADGSRAMTFAELDRRSLQVSRLLGGLGVQPRGHAALMMANQPEFFEIAWGAQRRGTYWTPVNWHLTAPEAQYIVEDSGAQVLFASPETADVAAHIAERLRQVRVFVVGGERPGLASCEPARDEQSTDPLEGEVGGGLLLLLGHHGTAQGDHAAARLPAVRHRRRPGAAHAGGFRIRAGLHLPVSRTALPRRADRLVHRDPPQRRHGRADGAVRRRGMPAGDRAAPGHARPVRAHPPGPREVGLPGTARRSAGLGCCRLGAARAARSSAGSL